jgi:peptide/nickel transport system substrate-binding protein
MSTRSRPGRIVLAAAAAALSLILAACSGGAGSQTSAANAAAGPPVSGGTLTYLTFEESNGFDPVLLRAGARAGDSTQASAIFDVLMFPDPQSLKMQMRIAESLSSKDNVTWDLVIRKGVTFTDGTPYDAEAVKFNWQRIADPANGSPSAGGMRLVKSLQVVSPLTLRITLKQAYSQLPNLVSRYLSYIGSPTAIKKLGDRFALQPVGAGPFKVESWVRDSQLVLVRNPNYWQAGKPYLDKVIAQQVPDDEQRYNSFVSGGAQVSIGGPNTVYGKRAEDQGFKVLRYTMGGGITMMFNTRTAPFNDVGARRAVAMALDLAKVNSVINEGTNSVPETLFAEGTPFYDAGIKLASAAQKTDEAQKLFDAYAARTGGPVKFEITTTTAMAQAFELLQAQLSSFKNVEAKFTVIQPTALVPILQNKKFQAATYALYADDIEPSMFDYYHSEGKTNFSGNSDPALDAALEAGRSATDMTARAKAYRTAQERIAADVTEVYIQRYVFTYLLANDVQGYESPSTGVRWDNVWLAK